MLGSDGEVGAGAALDAGAALEAALDSGAREVVVVVVEETLLGVPGFTGVPGTISHSHFYYVKVI